MGSKKPEPPPAQRIRVAIVGDHPWAENFGWVESVEPGKFLVLKVFLEDLVKVTLDNGHECYAGKQHLKIVERPTSPPQPRKRPS